MLSYYKTIFKILCLGSILAISYFNGYNTASKEWSDLLKKERLKQTEYVLSIERKWQERTNNVEEEYQSKLRSIQQSNDDTVNRLRQQLNSYARKLSKASKSSSESDGRTRESNISEGVADIIGFANKCSKRADELSIQLSSLQSWIKEVDHVEEEVLIK